jgi:hypothetical protein
MELPFSQYSKEDKLVRVFTTDVEEDELKWHQDLKDRVVEIVEDGGWKFQIENELPITLQKGMVLNIQKYSWHRVIKGNDNLIVEIKELE